MDSFISYYDFGLEYLNIYTTWWITQYETNPIHVILETLLIIFIIYVYFKRPSAKKSQLSEHEINDLIEEWVPEPLVPDDSNNSNDNNNSSNTAMIANDISTDFLVVEGRKGSVVSIQGLGDLIDMASFDFLGFATDESIKQECVEVLRTYGCGSCGPRGFYGTVDLHLELENAIANFFNVEESIMYSDSGSTVASVVPAFSKRGDLIICDQHVNDNLLTGMLLSRSKIIVYKHNDMNDLERILVEIKRKDAKTGNSPKTQRRFIVSEGLFRNTGQIVNLPVLNKLKKEHGCRLILDESLSFGVLGKTGRGVSEHFNMSIDSIDILASSLATSLGSVGGFCIGNEREVVDHQRLSGAGYCFSASTPPFVAKAATVALEKMAEHNYRLQHQLKLNLNEILEGIDQIPQLSVTSNENSPIIHLRLSNEWRTDDIRDEIDALRSIANMVREDGILIVESKYVHSAINLKAINVKINGNRRGKKLLTPSFPETTLRIVTSAMHKMEDIDTLIKALDVAVNELFANN